MNIQGMDFSGLKLFSQMWSKIGKDLAKELEFRNRLIRLGHVGKADRSLG